MKLGFKRINADPNLYFKVEKDKPLILVLYVEDLFLTGDDPLIHQCKREFASEFKMKYLGLMHYFLGLEVWQKPGEIFLSQGKYIVKLLKRRWMVDCKSVTTPMELNCKKLCGSVVGLGLANPTEYRQLMGALIFLVNSRPDICFTMNALSQYMVKPHHIHWITAKNLLRYLWGIIHYGLRYTIEDLRLHGYRDVDWAGSVVDPSMACCEAIWLRKLFNELFEHVLDTNVIFYDNHSGIRLSKNLVFHDRSKHIDIKYHFIWDIVLCGAVRLQHIKTDEQVADILMKPLGKVKFLTFRDKLGVMERPSYEDAI
eukprot:PITA_27267